MRGINESIPFTQALATARELSAAHLDGDGESWGTYSSRLPSYENTFRHLLRGGSIPALLSGRTEPLVLDMMASSEALADLLRQLSQPGKRGIAVSLADGRTEDKKQRDTVLGITQIAGDLTTATTWRSLEAEMAGRKADLILERAIGGLDVLPVHSAYYRYAMSKLWGMLSPEKGILLMEVPFYALESVGIVLEHWTQDLRNNNVFAEFENDTSTLCLIRTPDSPLLLPDW